MHPFRHLKNFYSIVNCIRTTSTSSKLHELTAIYNRTKQICYEQPYDKNVNPKGVFANNEIDLHEIDIYGFDYDYTLASYNKNLYRLIFNLARDVLINKYKYPKALEQISYDSKYPIRGLHFDKRNGWLMKIDSYHNIQLGTVFYGMKQVDDNDVKEFYKGTHIRIDDIGYTQTSSTMHHFIDLFCLPEIYLIASIIEYFLNNSIHFAPDYIFDDVHEAVKFIHSSELLHKEIAKTIHDYIVPINQINSSIQNQYEDFIKLKEFLLRLKKSNKKIFLITNSKFWFVNLGMNVLCGPDWKNLFDVIVCDARKPHFFTSRTKPFKQYYYDDPNECTSNNDNITNLKSWDRITCFEKGHIYTEGNLYQLLHFTNWSNKKILYFGDNLYSDLVQPFLNYGWRTGAIIHELKFEIDCINNCDYQRTISWLVNLESLIQQLMLINAQNNETNENLLLEKYILQQKWMQERDTLRKLAKSTFNMYFGSIFRTYHNPTFFSRRLSRFADIYTSNLTNLLEYPIDYHFIPRRLDMAHEHSSNINL